MKRRGALSCCRDAVLQAQHPCEKRLPSRQNPVNPTRHLIARISLLLLPCGLLEEAALAMIVGGAWRLKCWMLMAICPNWRASMQMLLYVREDVGSLLLHRVSFASQVCGVLTRVR